MIISYHLIPNVINFVVHKLVNEGQQDCYIATTALHNTLQGMQWLQ